MTGHFSPVWYTWKGGGGTQPATGQYGLVLEDTRVGLDGRTLFGRFCLFFNSFLYLMHLMSLWICLSVYPIPFLGEAFNSFKVHRLGVCVCVCENGNLKELLWEWNKIKNLKCLSLLPHSPWTRKTDCLVLNPSSALPLIGSLILGKLLKLFAF